MLDPNWFYSSLAQCSTALIGLLGAILATRTQQQIIEADAIRREMRKLITDYYQSFQSKRENLVRYITFASNHINKIKTAISSGIPDIPIINEVDFWGSQSGSIRKTVVNQAILIDYETYLSLAEQTVIVIDHPEYHLNVDF